MKAQLKKIGSKMYIEIPDSIKNLYHLKNTNKLSINVIERENVLIVNCMITMDE